MKPVDPAEPILFPVVISVRADTANLLSEMASEMGVTIDEVLSALAEESVSGLASLEDPSSLTDVTIPEKCSTEDLLKLWDV